MAKELQLTLPKCHITKTGLTFNGKLSFDEWQTVGDQLTAMDGAVKFWIGDWLNYGEATYGERYAQAMDKTKMNYHTLQNVAYVCRAVPASRRRESVSFENHYEIAKLEPKDQKAWLDRIENESLTRKDLRTALKRGLNARPIAIPDKVKLDIKLGDFRSAKVADNSVDLILTDPPYPEEFLPLWSDLSSFAVKVLKPGGFCIAYTGQLYLPEVIRQMQQNLEYYWLGMLYHKGTAGQQFKVNMFNRAKPILFFCKPPRVSQEAWINDVIESPVPDKGLHEWGQSVEPLITLLEAFSKPGDQVLDPFAGGGATLEACAKTKRNCLGYEIEKEAYNALHKRIWPD